MNVPQRTRIKICGLTSVEQACMAAQAGADAIGLVMYPPSSRAVTADQAAVIAAQLPAFVVPVALFVDPQPAEVQALVQQIPNVVLQFHGHESPEFCQQFERPYLKAVPMAEQPDLPTFAQRYGSAQGLLLDSHGKGKTGGSGTTFAWSSTDLSGITQAVVLAGGLHAGNVGQGIAQLQPWAVDVSSGVEAAPGNKDPQQVKAFIAQVRQADLGREHN